MSSPDGDRLPLQAEVGGNDPTRFDWKEAWYPIAYVRDLDPAKLTRFTLLNQDLVIWWDRITSQWRVFVDQCPHRLAPLSEGRIADDGLLECPYHGWAFRGTGDCDRIPQQQPDGMAHQSRRACAISLPATVQQGLLFTYPGVPDHAPHVAVPTIDAMAESPEEWICLDTMRDLPYDALTLLENVLDASHIPYTHHRTVGDRANAAPVELEVIESGQWGFKGFWQEGPRRGTLGSQTTQFVAPGLMWHDLTSKQFGRTLTVVYATPIRKGECRLFARFPFKFASPIPKFFIRLTPRWLSHISQNAILEDDQIFLHDQERYLQQAGGGENFAKAFYLPTSADRFVVALRQWVNHYRADPWGQESLPPRLPTATLLDRYHSHTIHCASCRTAQMRIQRLRWGCGVVAAIAWSLTPALLLGLSTSVGLAILLTGLSLSAVIAWIGLSQLERRFSEGRAIPPRNRLDRS